MSSLAAREASKVGVGRPLGQTAVVAAASDSRLRPRAPDALAAHHATVHFADGLFGVCAVFVNGEGETWWVARQPHFFDIAKLAERLLELTLARIDTQIGNVHSKAVVIFGASRAAS